MALRNKTGNKKPAAKAAPAKATKAKATKTTKTTKAAKAAAPARKRGPNADYGYKPGAKIAVDKSKVYGRKRGEVFAVLVSCNGKTVELFEEKAAAVLKGEPPRSYLRFFVGDGGCTLSGGKEAA